MAKNTTKPAAGHELSNSAKILGEIVKDINGRTRTHYLETGRDLIRATEILEHGKLGPWLKDNFGWSPSTARNYTNAAKLVDENAKIADLQPSAVMALAAPSVPESVKTAVLADLGAGKKATVAQIKAMIKASRPDKPAAAVIATAAAGPKSTYQSLVDLLKEVGLGVAKDAVKEAFTGTKAYQPGPRQASAAGVQEALPQPAPSQIPKADDDELKDLDLSSATIKDAA